MYKKIFPFFASAIFLFGCESDDNLDNQNNDKKVVSIVGISKFNPLQGNCPRCVPIDAEIHAYLNATYDDGEEGPVPDEEVQWSTSDSQAISVNSDGVLTGKVAATAVDVIATYQGEEYRVQVAVTQEDIDSVVIKQALNNTSKRLTPGTHRQLYAEVNYVSGATLDITKASYISWQSDNPDVAGVSIYAEDANYTSDIIQAGEVNGVANIGVCLDSGHCSADPLQIEVLDVANATDDAVSGNEVIGTETIPISYEGKTLEFKSPTLEAEVSTSVIFGSVTEGDLTGLSGVKYTGHSASNPEALKSACESFGVGYRLPRPEELLELYRVTPSSAYSRVYAFSHNTGWPSSKPYVVYDEDTNHLTGVDMSSGNEVNDRDIVYTAVLLSCVKEL